MDPRFPGNDMTHAKAVISAGIHLGRLEPETNPET